MAHNLGDPFPLFPPFIDPCWDPVFKSIFTRDTPPSRIAIRRLLSAIIEQKLDDVTITANEPPLSRSGDRQIRYDINCVLNGGEKANVEMTLYPSAWEQLRLEYYLGRLFTSQEIRGQYASYRDLRRSYQISLLANRKLFDDDRFDHRFIYYDPEAKRPLGGRTAIITLELEKLGKAAEKPVETLTEKERWGLFFRYWADEDKRDVIRELIVKEEGIAMAAEVMTRFSADEIAYFHEISKEKYELDMRAHRDEAWEGGLEKGREEIARTLLSRGWAAEETAELTKLPLEKVRSLP